MEAGRRAKVQVILRTEVKSKMYGVNRHRYMYCNRSGSV